MSSPLGNHHDPEKGFDQGTEHSLRNSVSSLAVLERATAMAASKAKNNASPYGDCQQLSSTEDSNLGSSVASQRSVTGMHTFQNFSFPQRRHSGRGNEPQTSSLMRTTDEPLDVHDRTVSPVSDIIGTPNGAVSPVSTLQHPLMTFEMTDIEDNPLDSNDTDIRAGTSSSRPSAPVRQRTITFDDERSLSSSPVAIMTAAMDSNIDLPNTGFNSSTTASSHDTDSLRLHNPRPNWNHGIEDVGQQQSSDHQHQSAAAGSTTQGSGVDHDGAFSDGETLCNGYRPATPMPLRSTIGPPSTIGSSPVTDSTPLPSARRDTTMSDSSASAAFENNRGDNSGDSFSYLQPSEVHNIQTQTPPDQTAPQQHAEQHRHIIQELVAPIALPPLARVRQYNPRSGLEDTLSQAFEDMEQNRRALSMHQREYEAGRHSVHHQLRRAHTHANDNRTHEHASLSAFMNRFPTPPSGTATLAPLSIRRGPQIRHLGGTMSSTATALTSTTSVIDFADHHYARHDRSRGVTNYYSELDDTLDVQRTSSRPMGCTQILVVGSLTFLGILSSIGAAAVLITEGIAEKRVRTAVVIWQVLSLEILLGVAAYLMVRSCMRHRRQYRREHDVEAARFREVLRGPSAASVDEQDGGGEWIELQDRERVGETAVVDANVDINDDADVHTNSVNVNNNTVVPVAAGLRGSDTNKQLPDLTAAQEASQELFIVGTDEEEEQQRIQDENWSKFSQNKHQLRRYVEGLEEKLRMAKDRLDQHLLKDAEDEEGANNTTQDRKGKGKACDKVNTNIRPSTTDGSILTQLCAGVSATATSSTNRNSSVSPASATVVRRGRSSTAPVMSTGTGSSRILRADRLISIEQARRIAAEDQAPVRLELLPDGHIRMRSIDIIHGRIPRDL